jgi:RNA polymerase sigma-70 factor (ECF subfamily)
LPHGEPRGDLDAWVLATASDAVAYAASLLRDRSAAEDVVQDCYCRLLARADVYNLPTDGRKLLFTAVTNACINRNTRARPILSLHGPDEERVSWEPVAKAGTQPDLAAMQRELQRAVDEGLARLPVAQRAALELKGMGYSLQEIGDMLEVTPSNAGVLVYRARRAMAQFLAPFVEERAG